MAIQLAALAARGMTMGRAAAASKGGQAAMSAMQFMGGGEKGGTDAVGAGAFNTLNMTLGTVTEMGNKAYGSMAMSNNRTAVSSALVHPWGGHDPATNPLQSPPQGAVRQPPSGKDPELDEQGNEIVQSGKASTLPPPPPGSPQVTGASIVPPPKPGVVASTPRFSSFTPPPRPGVAGAPKPAAPPRPGGESKMYGKKISTDKPAKAGGLGRGLSRMAADASRKL